MKSDRAERPGGRRTLSASLRGPSVSENDVGLIVAMIGQRPWHKPTPAIADPPTSQQVFGMLKNTGRIRIEQPASRTVFFENLILLIGGPHKTEHNGPPQNKSGEGKQREGPWVANKIHDHS